MEDEYCSYKEFLALIHIALTWWQQYFDTIFDYAAHCVVCGKLGHSTKKKDGPLQANKKLQRNFKAFKRHHHDASSNDFDDFELLRTIFEEERREALEKI